MTSPRPTRSHSTTAGSLFALVGNEACQVMACGARHVPAACLVRKPACVWHSAHSGECHTQADQVCRQQVGTVGACKSCASCAPSRTLLGGGGKSARAGGKPTEYVAVMGGLSPVPLGQRQGPWRDRWRRTVPSARKKRENDFRIRSVLGLREMEAACEMQVPRSSAGRCAKAEC